MELVSLPSVNSPDKMAISGDSYHHLAYTEKLHVDLEQKYHAYLTTHIKSKLSLLFLSHRSVHSNKNTISISLLHIVKLSNYESQQVSGHDGSASKGHTL